MAATPSEILRLRLRMTEGEGHRMTNWVMTQPLTHYETFHYRRKKMDKIHHLPKADSPLAKDAQVNVGTGFIPKNATFFRLPEKCCILPSPPFFAFYCL